MGELASASRDNYNTTPIYAQPATEQITPPPVRPVSGGRPFRVEFPDGRVLLINDYSPEGAFRQALAQSGAVASSREVHVTY
jgi:hypothetical protein